MFHAPLCRTTSQLNQGRDWVQGPRAHQTPTGEADLDGAQSSLGRLRAPRKQSDDFHG